MLKIWRDIYHSHFLVRITRYRKVASSSLSRLVAHFQIFRRLMKGKFDAYVLWPLAKRVQNSILDRSTARDFTITSTFWYRSGKFKIGKRMVSQCFKMHWSHLDMWRHGIRFYSSKRTHSRKKKPNFVRCYISIQAQAICNFSIKPLFSFQNLEVWRICFEHLGTN